MDALPSRAVASRSPWSKNLHKKKLRSHHPLAVALPVLARRPSDQQLHTKSHNNSLHGFLASQLEGNDRSRSQLRAMASSKLYSSSNNSINARTASSAGRLAPLVSASMEKTRTLQRQALPKPLQAAINNVLPMRNTDEELYERGESHSFDDMSETPKILSVKRTSPCKTPHQSRRPEWARYIRRIMMTKGIQGSTLARYRRLVGIVARKSLTQSLAEAVERVVRSRLKFQSAAIIQAMTHKFLIRRRLVEQQQRHQAAVIIQHVWRRVLQLKEKQRQLAQVTRQAKIDRLLRVGATRSIQRSYREYRHICYLRGEERREKEQASMLEKARLKLVRRYQSWRENSQRGKMDQKSEFTEVKEVLSIALQADTTKNEFCMSHDETVPRSVHEHVEVATIYDWIVRDTAETSCSAADQAIFPITEPPSAPIDTVSHENIELENDHEFTQLGDFIPSLQDGQSSGIHETLPTAGYIDENKSFHKDELAVDSSTQDEQNDTLSCSSSPQDDDVSTSEVTTAFVLTKTWSGGNESAEIDEGIADVEMAAELSDLQRPPDEELVTVATAATTKTAAAERITRFLLPKFQARLVRKTHAAIQIQCLARSYMAKLCLLRVRLVTLHSLRAQLLSTWCSATNKADTKVKLSDSRAHDPVVDYSDDEDDELDRELQGLQPSLHGVSANYVHLLPTRNGLVPPGVPLLQSAAGASLLSLWKWSWPDKRWLSNGQ